MTFLDSLSYTFLQRALFAGVAIGLLCAILGVFLVLRRFSLIGDGLAHFTFGSVALAMFFNVSPPYVTLAALPCVLIAAIGILRLSERARVGGDAAIGIVSALGIAGGIILASLAGGFNVDLFGYLFGSILSISNIEVWLAVSLCLSVLCIIVVFYRALLATTFDEELARTTGINTTAINSLLVLLAALTVVLAMKLVGIMLISALLILPPVAALQLARGFTSTLILSGAIGIISVISGIAVSVSFNLPTGATIIVAAFCLFLAAGLLRRYNG